MMKIVHTEDVDALRRAAYPPLEDFADAWLHLQHGDASKVNEYFARCMEVKTLFPKPLLTPTPIMQPILAA